MPLKRVDKREPNLEPEYCDPYVVTALSQRRWLRPLNEAGVSILEVIKPTLEQLSLLSQLWPSYKNTLVSDSGISYFSQVKRSFSSCAIPPPSLNKCYPVCRTALPFPLPNHVTPGESPNLCILYKPQTPRLRGRSPNLRSGKDSKPGPGSHNKNSLCIL